MHLLHPLLVIFSLISLTTPFLLPPPPQQPISSCLSSVLTHLRMPSSPLDHITNTYVLRSAIKEATATGTSLHVILRPTSSNPTPTRGQVFDYLQECYRYIWDAISTAPTPTTPTTPTTTTTPPTPASSQLLDVLLYPPLPNVASPTQVTQDPAITTIVGTAEARGWFEGTSCVANESTGANTGTLSDHTAAVSAARLAHNLPPIIKTIELSPPPEITCLAASTDVIFYELAGYNVAPPAHSLADPTGGFEHVAVGGTFDRLHYGHRRLITLALSSVGEKGGVLTVGVTSDEMIKVSEGGGTNADLCQCYKRRRVVARS